MSSREFRFGDIRVQFLNPALVRIEQRGPGGFEDRSTFLVLDRHGPGDEVRESHADGRIHFRGTRVEVTLPASAASIRDVRVLDASTGDLLWSGADDAPSTPVWPDPRAPGRLWALADAPRVVPPPWGATPAPAGALSPDDPRLEVSGWDLDSGAPDVYVFAHGGDLARWRADYLQLTGRIALPPLWAFGFWHSLYYPYTEREALATIDAYRKHDFPIDVFVVDTDWRVGGSGGYDVETRYFPDMPAFLRNAHARNVRVMFNDHPQPNGMEPVEPAMLKFRSDGLTKFLAMGLDAWWYDFNWVEIIPGPIDGIDKGVWGQRLYHDIVAAHAPDRRVLLMSMRSDHGACHRFPVWWTGDIPSTYDAMTDGIRDSVRDGLRLMPYVNQDLGGHLDQPDDEQYVRWLQWGSLSPVTRIHGTRKEGLFRDPWRFGSDAFAVMRDYVKLRYRLLPVLYAAARRAYDDGTPLLRALPLEWPGEPGAVRDDEYLLGDDLLVAPIHASAPAGGVASRTVWIPPGEWIDAWTGAVQVGPREIRVDAPLAKTPLFIRRGSAILLAPPMAFATQTPWDPITVEIVPPPSGTVERILYEDDGTTLAYQRGEFRRLAIRVTGAAGRATVTVGPGDDRPGRRWRLRLHLPRGSARVRVATGGNEIACRLLDPDPAGDARMPLLGWGSAPRSLEGPMAEVECAIDALRSGVMVDFS